MKKRNKIVIIVLVILVLLSFGVRRIIYGPSVSLKEKAEVKNYVQSYLTKKYGKHNYKITGISYDYHRTDMSQMFDYSNPIGYWVYFKSDTVPSSWIVIKGVEPEEYIVDSDYYVESYHFRGNDDAYELMESMEPKKEIENKYLNELQNEFDSNVCEVRCDYIMLEIPEDYGKVPTIEELKTNIDLYKTLGFDFKVSNIIQNETEFEQNLKTYIANKYHRDFSIWMYPNRLGASVDFDD